MQDENFSQIKIDEYCNEMGKFIVNYSAFFANIDSLYDRLSEKIPNLKDLLYQYQCKKWTEDLLQEEWVGIVGESFNQKIKEKSDGNDFKEAIKITITFENKNNETKINYLLHLNKEKKLPKDIINILKEFKDSKAQDIRNDLAHQPFLGGGDSVKGAEHPGLGIEISKNDNCETYDHSEEGKLYLLSTWSLEKIKDTNNFLRAKINDLRNIWEKKIVTIN